MIFFHFWEQSSVFVAVTSWHSNIFNTFNDFLQLTHHDLSNWKKIILSIVKVVSKNKIKGKTFQCSPTSSALKRSLAEEKRKVAYTLSAWIFQIPQRKEIDSLAKRHHNFLCIYNFPEKFGWEIIVLFLLAQLACSSWWCPADANTATGCGWSSPAQFNGVSFKSSRRRRPVLPSFIFFLFRFYYDKLWPKSIAHSCTQVMLPVHWLQNLELRITLILFSLRAGWRAERAGEETVIPKNEERSLRVSCWASSPAKQHPATKIFWGRVHW